MFFQRYSLKCNNNPFKGNLVIQIEGRFNPKPTKKALIFGQISIGGLTYSDVGTQFYNLRTKYKSDK